MASDPDREILTVAGREVAISNPHKVLFPAGRLHEARPRRATTSPSPTARCAAPAAGRTCSCAIRTASAASSSSRSARPTSRPPWIEVVALTFPSGRTAEEVVPRDAAALAWMANLACLELHPHPVRADDLDHPDELRVDLDPVPGVAWPQIREVARVVRATLDDFGLIGWPKTSGSRGIHVYVRIERRWTFDEVRRAALALAREVERRAPGLATSKWWKEERHGVFLDYNQNAKDRTIASAYSVRPTPDARVSAPLDVGRGRRAASSADFTLATMPARFAAIGDRHARHRRACRARSSASSSCRRSRSARAWATRRGRRTTRSRRASRRACSRRSGAATPESMPLIEIGRAPKKDDALAGLERWKARHPDAAAHLRAGRRARRRDARALQDLDAHPGQPAARARGAAARRRKRSTRTTRRTSWRAASACRRYAPAPKTFASS